MEINLYLSGLSKLRDDLAAIKARIGDPSPALAKCAVAILDTAVERINVGGSPPWIPTKYPANLHHILIETGNLRNSLSSSNAGAVEWITDAHIRVGTNVEYAPYLQFGTRTMPARPFLYIDSALADRLKRIVADFIWRGQ